MSKATQKRRPYQFSLGELLSLLAAFAVSFGLLRWGLLSGGLLLVASGIVLAGGVIGAVIGRAFEDERGGMSWMGAYLGAIVPVVIVLLAPFVVLVVISVIRFLW